MFRTSFILTCAALAVSISAAVSGPVARAQEQSVTVNIPFSFSANDQKLPAGTYRVSLLSSRYLLFVNTKSVGDTKPIGDVYLMVLPASSQNGKDHGRLIFRRYGSSNYLYQVWMSGQSEGREFVRSRDEQETLRDTNAPAMAQVQIPVGSAQH
jgi:hypothetical protein